MARTAFIVFLLIITALTAIGQKKPPTIGDEKYADDNQLCGVTKANNGINLGDKPKIIRFCELYKTYLEKHNSLAAGDQILARDARNDMIELVRGQIDTYYAERKNGKRTRNKAFQFFLDILEVGGATAISIMNGERAKSVVAAGISGLQAGRTSYNKNFEALQLQILINKMNEKRATVMLEISEKKNRMVRTLIASDGYRWEEARTDLKRYLTAGTYGDALDSLIEQTGEDSKDAQKKLAQYSPEVAERNVIESRTAAQILVRLKTDLTDNDKKAKAQTNLQNVVKRLFEKDDEFKTRLTTLTITDTSDGEEIRKALIALKSKLLDDDRDDLILVVNEIIIEEAGNN